MGVGGFSVNARSVSRRIYFAQSPSGFVSRHPVGESPVFIIICTDVTRVRHARTHAAAKRARKRAVK